MRAFALLLLATAAHAQSPLDAVAVAMGIDSTVVSVEVRTETTATLDGREVTVPARRTTRRRSARWRTTWGGATRTVSADERGVFAEADGDHTRLGPEAAADVRAAVWLDAVAIALRRARLDARDLGAGLVRVRAPGLAEPVVVKLDGAGRPARFSTFVVRGGDRVYAEVVLRDWRERDGLWVPHSVVMSEGGRVRGRTTVTGVTVERAGG